MEIKAAPQLNSKTNHRSVILISSLFILAMLLIILAIIPNFRAKIKSFLIFSGRNVIAKTSGNVTPNGPEVTAIKLFEDGKLYVEFYELQKDSGLLVQIGKINLNDSKDGFFIFQGNSTNLAMYDSDNDGNLEVVAPTFDMDNNPRLNIFKYNPDNHHFEKTDPH